jgi:DNA-binding NarL/FixJ family response regulator
VGCGTVLVVDVDDAWRSHVASLLLRAGLATVGASSGADALACARQQRPDVVLLDVALPDIDGYVVCRELRESFGEALPIVLLSADRNDVHDRTAALLIGADDYLKKPVDPAELFARVRRHLTRARGASAHPNGAGRTAGMTDQTGVTDKHGLTRRELDVLRLLAGGHQQQEIASRLFISPKTVSSHIQRILGKLGVHSRAQAVALAHREGLVDDFAAHSVTFA